MLQLVIKWHIVLMFYLLYIYNRRFKYRCTNNEIVYSNITNNENRTTNSIIIKIVSVIGQT